MSKKLIVGTLLLFAVLAGIGFALVPPPPPPPVPQNLGIYDTTFNFLVTNATDQSACRQCHQTSGTNVNSSGYNNTIGGVPTRHHNLVAEANQGIINPFTNVTFGCQDCHPSTGNGVLLDRSCQDCHNGTTFWGNSIGGRVGNFSRPHHINTTYDDANIGNPAPNGLCKFCHGSFVDNYNDSHYIPSYNTSFMITPFATFKITNFSQPALGGNKTWGGCESCHLGDLNSTPYPTVNNIETHHVEFLINIDGFNGSNTNIAPPWPGRHHGSGQCTDCHIKNPDGTLGCIPENPPPPPPPNGGTPDICPAFNIYNANPTAPGGIENITRVIEVRNSTIEQQDFAIGALEPGTTNVSINGTGCEKCHSVRSLHNIQFNYVQNGPQGFGHINNNTDCYGCHNSWLPADTWIPGPLIPTVDSVVPSVVTVGTGTTLSITGTNFINPDGNYTSVVKIDGVTYTPSSETATQISVNIPGLNAGVHQLQLVKGGDTLSKLWILTVVPNPTITSATLNKGTITITGSGFGSKPTNASMYVSVNHTGNQIVSTAINGWSSNQIKAKNSGAGIGDIVTVMTENAGEVQTVITG